jgi:hypothetical protein
MLNEDPAFSAIPVLGSNSAFEINFNVKVI